MHECFVHDSDTQGREGLTVWLYKLQNKCKK